MKKRILVLTSLAVLLVSGKNARANEYQKYSDRWSRCSDQCEQVTAKVLNLDEDLKAIKKNPYLAQKLKPVADKIRQEMESFYAEVCVADEMNKKFNKIYSQAAKLMYAYHKGKHVLWSNLLIICEAYDYLQEVSPKLPQCLDLLGTGHDDQQTQYENYLTQLNGEVEVLKAGEHPQHIDPSLIPVAGIKLPLLSTALAKKQEMDQVIFDRGIVPRNQKINYDFLPDLLGQKARKWHDDIPTYGSVKPAKPESKFWYDDDQYQIKMGKKPNSTKPKETPEEEKKRQEKEHQQQVFDQQVITFFQRLAHDKGYQEGRRFYNLYYVFSDRIRDEYLAMRQKAIDAKAPMTDLPAFEATISCTNQLILFSDCYYPGLNSLQWMSKALKRVIIGELAQRTLRMKITPLVTEMERILQKLEPLIKARFQQFNALADELEERKASLKQQLTGGIFKKTNLLDQIDSILKDLKNSKKGQKKALSDLISEEMMARDRFNKKRSEIKHEDQEQQVLMIKNRGLQKQKNDLTQKINDCRLQLEQNAKNQAISTKRIEIFHNILPTLVVQEEKNQAELQELQGQLSASLQQQRQEEEASVINNEAVKVASEEVARQQEQIKQIEVELEKTKLGSDVFSDQEVIDLTSKLQELREQIQKNQAEADHLQQNQQEYLDLSQQLMSISAELQQQKELQGDLDQSIEQLKLEFKSTKQINSELVQSLNKVQDEVKARQQTMELLSGIDHCSDLSVPAIFCYSRIQNIRDESIRYMVRGTLTLGLDHVDLDCHGLIAKDIKDYVARVIKILGEIDFSADPEKILQINFITGHGRHSAITEFSVIKEELINVLQNLEINILDSDFSERGVVKAVFDQRFLLDHPQGFKIRKINYKKLRELSRKN